MSMQKMERKRFGAKLLLVALLPLAGLGACGLDEIRVPPLVGPAEQGLSIDLRAVPNILNADGVSTSTVTITVRNQNGAPVANRQLYVQLNQGDGVLIAGAVVVGPLQGGISLGTASNGVAQITYQAGTTRGLQAIIIVQAYSFDAAGGGEVPHTVVIDQR